MKGKRWISGSLVVLGLLMAGILFLPSWWKHYQQAQELAALRDEFGESVTFGDPARRLRPSDIHPLLPKKLGSFWKRDGWFFARDVVLPLPPADTIPGLSFEVFPSLVLKEPEGKFVLRSCHRKWTQASRELSPQKINLGDTKLAHTHEGTLLKSSVDKESVNEWLQARVPCDFLTQANPGSLTFSLAQPLRTPSKALVVLKMYDKDGDEYWAAVVLEHHGRVTPGNVKDALKRQFVSLVTMPDVSADTIIPTWILEADWLTGLLWLFGLLFVLEILRRVLWPLLFVIRAGKAAFTGSWKAGNAATRLIKGLRASGRWKGKEAP